MANNCIVQGCRPIRRSAGAGSYRFPETNNNTTAAPVGTPQQDIRTRAADHCDADTAAGY